MKYWKPQYRMELRDQYKQNMKNKFSSFIFKYKYLLIYIVFFAFVSFIFNPKQKEYYLERDIRAFEENLYPRIALFSSAILICIMLAIGFLKKLKFNQILNLFISGSYICFMIFFLMQSTVTCFCLFINRLDTKKEINWSYKTIYITDNKYFMARNIHQSNDRIDESDYYKYFELKDPSKLKNGDIIRLKFKQGLLNINYFNIKNTNKN